MHREVRVRPGSHYKVEDAEVIERELDALIGDKDGVTSEEILDAAAPKKSPLHRFFNWDDKAAAKEYRLAQARDMAGAVQIRVIRDDNEPSEDDWMRKYHVVQVPIPETKTSEARYVPMGTVATNTNYLDQVCRNAKREWQSWERRYRQYFHMPEFAAVLSEIGGAFAEVHEPMAAD